MNSACDGKERFQTFALAERVMKMRRRGVKLGRQTYRCHACGGYHIGTSLQLQVKRVRGESYVTARDDDEAYA